MKLLNNSENSGVFSYFIGTDNLTSFTEENPAVWNSVRQQDSDGYYYFDVSLSEISYGHKWLYAFIKANQSLYVTTNYVSDYKSYLLYCNVYDGLTRKLIRSDMECKGQYLSSDSKYSADEINELKFDIDTILLFQFFVKSSEALNRNYRVYFSHYRVFWGKQHFPQQFRYNPRFLRDYNKVLPPEHRYKGKMNKYNSLSSIDRNAKKQYHYAYRSVDGDVQFGISSIDEIDTLHNGVKSFFLNKTYSGIPYGEFSNLQYLFEKYDSINDTVKDFGFQGDVFSAYLPKYQDYFLLKQKTILRIEYDGYYSFLTAHDDGVCFRFNGLEKYLSGATNYYVPLFHNIYLTSGYYDLQAFLFNGNGGRHLRVAIKHSVSELTDEQWNVSLSKDNLESNGWYLIPTSSFFTDGNVTDICHSSFNGCYADLFYNPSNVYNFTIYDSDKEEQKSMSAVKNWNAIINTTETSGNKYIAKQSLRQGVFYSRPTNHGQRLFSPDYSYSYCAIHFYGLIYIDKPQDIMFSTKQDDAFAISINGKQFTNSSTYSSPYQTGSYFNVRFDKSGYYHFDIYFSNSSRNSSSGYFDLYWKRQDSDELTLVPDQVFFIDDYKYISNNGISQDIKIITSNQSNDYNSSVDYYALSFYLFQIAPIPQENQEDASENIFSCEDFSLSYNVSDDYINIVQNNNVVLDIQLKGWKDTQRFFGITFVGKYCFVFINDDAVIAFPLERTNTTAFSLGSQMTITSGVQAYSKPIFQEQFKYRFYRG